MPHDPDPSNNPVDAARRAFAPDTALVVEVLDVGMGLYADMPRAVVEALGLDVEVDGDGPRAAHVVSRCPDAGCLACAALLCPDDCRDHFAPRCSSTGCNGAGPRAAVDALRSARVAATVAEGDAAAYRAEARGVANDAAAWRAVDELMFGGTASSPPTPAPAPTSAPRGVAPSEVALGAAVLARHPVRPFLFGLQGGAGLAGREIPGLAAVLSVVEMAITTVDRAAAAPVGGDL